MTANVNKWIGVILSAVVLGMAVVYLINTWMPECTKQWIVWSIVALIAVRSVMRIAQLAKQAGKREENE
jgi:membrane protein YdbS with pleckstrin-like domain